MVNLIEDSMSSQNLLKNKIVIKHDKTLFYIAICKKSSKFLFFFYFRKIIS